MQITKKAKRKRVLKGMRENNFHGVTNGKKRFPDGKKYIKAVDHI